MAHCIHGTHWDGVSPFWCPQCSTGVSHAVAPFIMSTVHTPSWEASRYALRLYVKGEGTGELLADYRPEHECPQWHYNEKRRYTWATPEEALDFLTFEVLPRWPEFREQDIRVVCVVPPMRQQYVEVTTFRARSSGSAA